VTEQLQAPAKINLWLRIGPRRASGYHDLDTLFAALELADTVTVRGADGGTGVRLRTTFEPPLEALPDLGPPGENLVVRAAAAFGRRAGMDLNLEIDLVKRIPAGGGLGGGSSDAAATMRALAWLFPDALEAGEIHAAAAELGSDVPFFAADLDLARGQGRGTDLTPLPPLPPRPVLVALPGIHVPTARAYAWLGEARAHGAMPPPTDLPDRSPGPLSWDRVSDLAHNDFEPVLFARYPRLRAIRDTMRKHGARFALLAGSGSALFGVFDDVEGAAAAAAAIRRHDPDARTTLTRTRSR
jgi:4-diphosphocytidyl-2-C-methyl-D-erythritol kinase